MMKRGFYELSDTHRRCIEQFLMHGFDSGGTDIPHSFVEGFSDVSRDVFDTKKVSVGATNIRTE